MSASHHSHVRGAALIAIALLYTAPSIAATPAHGKSKKPLAASHTGAKASKSTQTNAYDIFIDAASMVVDNEKISYALNTEHKSGDPLDREYTLDEKTQFVQENAKALARLREGFAYEYHNPPVRSFADIEFYYKDFRKCARVLALEADVAHAKHDTRTAINSSLDAIQLGEVIQRDSPILGLLVGIACQAIGRRPLMKEISQSVTGVEGSKEGALRLSRILAMHVPYTDILRTEKQTDLASLTELYQHPAIAATAVQKMSEGDDSGQQGQVAERLFSALLQSDKDEVIASYSNQMDSLIERYGQPYNNTLVPISRQSDPLTLSKYKLLYECRFKDVASELASRCLMTMLALNAYLADHKSYPASLQALTPTYLPRVPGDPFAQDAPLHYSLQGKNADLYTLYSIGPDGQDDGGKVAYNPDAKTENTKTIIYPDSLGDFNAAINHY